MVLTDWKKIKFFTPAEVEATGASAGAVSLNLMLSLDRFRSLIGVPVHLIKDGMTTGHHKSPGHPNGFAADMTLGKWESTSRIVSCALQAGFTAIGVYWNGQVHSLHLEIRDVYSFWYGLKPAPGVGEWKMRSLFFEPDGKSE